MRQLYTFLGLFKGVNVLMQLGEKGAQLHPNLALVLHLLHSLSDGLSCQRTVVLDVVQRILQSDAALLKLSKLLVADSHVDKDDQAEVLVPGAALKGNDIHDAMGLLQQDQSSLIVLHLGFALVLAVNVPEGVLNEL